MKKLKQKQLGHFCSYCPPKTERAVWRADYWTLLACEKHKLFLQQSEKWHELNEADRQTWARNL